MGLERLTFNYEGICFVVGTEQITTTPDGKPINSTPFLLFPVTVKYPSGKQIDRQVCFDGVKMIFLGNLIEDKEMAKHHPVEYAKSTKSDEDLIAWQRRWDGYRLEMSRIFGRAVLEGEVEDVQW